MIDSDLTTCLELGDALARLVVESSGEEPTESVLMRLVHVIRFGTAAFLFLVFFYLTAIAKDPDGNRIPLRFRATVFILSFMLLDHGREGTVFHGLAPELVVLVIYLTFCGLVWHSFMILTKHYNIPRPREGIKLYLVELRDDLKSLRRRN